MLFVCQKKRFKMLYGYTRDNVTVIGAASTVVELEGWYQKVMEDVSGLFSTRRETEFLDHLTNPEFMGYKHPAYIFEHISVDEQNAFITQHEVKIMQPMQVKDFMLDMMSLVDDSLRSGFDLRDSRTIGEISGLDGDEVFDPWDKRTEKEKAAAKAMEKRTDELRKRLGDHVTGQSFDPNPRSGGTDGIKITEIFDDGQGGINIKGKKFGSGKNAANTTDPLKKIGDTMKNIISGKGIDYVSDEKLSKMDSMLSEVGYSEEEITEIKENFDLTTDEGKKDYVEIVEGEYKRRRLADALQPVEGNKSKEEILKEVERKLRSIPELTGREIGELLEAVETKLDQPTPKPADYKFALNEKLTAEPAMRGKGTPIFTFEKNENGPNESEFGISDLPLLFPKDSGFDMISGNIYEYTGGSAEDGIKELSSRGFIEDKSIVGNKAKIKTVTNPAYLPTPEDFARALAGNGTSTASVTDSWGRIAVGMVSDPEMEEFVPGISGEQGAILDQFAGVKKVVFDDLPASIKNGIGRDLSDLEKSGKTIKVGDYNGVNIASSNRYPVIETATHKIRNDLSGNINDYGGTKVGNVTTRIMSRQNNRYKGVVVFESETEVIILTF